MALLNAYQLTDDQDMAYAETWNQMYNTSKGNQVISGCGVTEQATPDLTVAVAAGSVLVSGSIKTVSSGNVDLSTEQAALTTGQARFVYVYVDSAGTVTKLAGTAATAGQQYPPVFSSLPTSCVVLARVLLTEGDTAINTADIHEMRQYVPSGIYTTGGIISKGKVWLDSMSDGFQINDDVNNAAKMLLQFVPGTDATDWRMYFAPRNTADSGWNSAREFGWDQANDRWYAEQLAVGNDDDISPDSAGSGQLQLRFNGYQGYITGDGTGMYLGHNSGVRDLALQTNETDRIVIAGNGSVAKLKLPTVSLEGNSNNVHNNIASFYQTGNPLTKQCKIVLPTNLTDSALQATMLSIKIEGFHYYGGRCGWGITVSAYTGYATLEWGPTNTFNVQTLYGVPPFSTVKLGNDGTNDFILLGEVTTNWYYPTIAVTQILQGYKSYDLSSITISMVSTEPTTVYRTISFSSLTSVEIDQLANIDASTISATQWGYLGGLDQALKTTDNVTHNTITANGYLKAPTIGMRIQNWASGNNPPTINSTINATNDGSSRTIEAPANVRYVVSATLKISHPGYAGDSGTASGYLKYYNSSGSWTTLGTVSITYSAFPSSDQLAISTNVIGQTIGGTGKYRLELVITTGTPTANITVELLSGATLQIEGVIQSV